MMKLWILTLIAFGAGAGFRVLWPEKRSITDVEVRIRPEPSLEVEFESRAHILEDPRHLLTRDPVDRLVGIARRAAGASHDEVLSWIRKKPACTDLEWRVLLTRWAESDPEGYVAEALALIEGDEPFTEETVQSVRRELELMAVRDDPQTVLAEREVPLSKLGSPDRERVLTAYEAWLKRDRVGAMAAIEAIEDPSEREDLRVLAAKVWAEQAPEAAMEWALSLSEEDERRTILQGAFNVVSNRDPDRAWQLMKVFGTKILENDGAYHHRIIARAAQFDLGQVLDWMAIEFGNEEYPSWILDEFGLGGVRVENLGECLLRLPEGGLREHFASQILAQRHSKLGERVAQVDALEGVDHDRLLARILKDAASQYEAVAANVGSWSHLPPEDRSEIVKNTAARWVSENPADAAAWLSGLPEGFAEQGHFKELWRRWTEFQPRAASSALGELSPGPDRDAAVAGLLESAALGSDVVVPDFEAAWEWTRLISAPEERTPAAAKVEAEWRVRDPEGASAYLGHGR